MIQYLVILLDDTSTSYCHYTNKNKAQNLIGLETLRKGILFGMEENLNIQIVYPFCDLPKEYVKELEDVDCVRIKPVQAPGEADAVVFNDLAEAEEIEFNDDLIYILRIDKATLFKEYVKVERILEYARRLNIILTDVDSFTDNDFDRYESVLSHLNNKIESLYSQGGTPQCNVLTDRIMLKEMNNCGAGETTVTLAPDGKFYACPAFYLCDKCGSIGDVENGLNIKNPQLYRLDHSPICRNCDAFQCHRCIWLNKDTTLEVNTPSHKQCVVAHLERNASRKLHKALAKYSDIFASYEEIKEIDYLDPFENRIKWKEK